jgi:scyllo-inositol 2-dehydrogenase (NADP+)
MAKKSPIKVAVVGLGRAGYNIHIARMRNDDRFQITAVADLLPARLAEVAAEFGCEGYPNHRAMLKKTDAEIVVAATYSDTHVAVSKDILRSGRAAICEKPISDRLAIARGLLTTAQQTQQNLFIHQNYRFFPETRHLLEIIKSKRIGEVFEIRMRAFGFSRRYDWQTLRKFKGGVLNNTCPHFLDIGLQLLGSPVAEVFCDLKQIASLGDVEDHVKVILKGENGRVYDMEVSSACAFNEPKWTLLGSHGTMTSDGSTSTIRWFDPKQAGKLKVIPTPLPGRVYCEDKGLKWQEEQIPSKGPDIGDFYDNVWAVTREKKPMVVKPEEALEVVRITEICQRKSGYY